jgi:hypothetical protein
MYIYIYIYAASLLVASIVMLAQGHDVMASTSDSELELPPDVEDNQAADEVAGEMDDGDDDVELPPDVPDVMRLLDDQHASALCSCKRDCVARYDMQKIAFDRLQMLNQPSGDRLPALYNRVRLAVTVKNKPTSKNVSWKHDGAIVCKPFFCHVNACGHSTIEKFKMLIDSGHQTLDLASFSTIPGVRSHVQKNRADAWFMMLYDSLAEPWATEECANLLDDNLETCFHMVEPGHPLWIRAEMSLSGSSGAVPKRYLNPGSFEDLWSLYSHANDETKVSKSTLLNSWNVAWKYVMPFRNVGQGKRCKVCAALSEERVQCVTKEEKDDVSARHQAHVDDVMADRAVNVRGNKLAELHARKPTADGLNQIAKITIDGMDQSKFRVPRNLVTLTIMMLHL